MPSAVGEPPHFLVRALRQGETYPVLIVPPGLIGSQRRLRAAWIAQSGGDRLTRLSACFHTVTNTFPNKRQSLAGGISDRNDAAMQKARGRTVGRNDSEMFLDQCSDAKTETIRVR